jgi:hypothetical protein
LDDLCNCGHNTGFVLNFFIPKEKKSSIEYYCGKCRAKHLEVTKGEDSFIIVRTKDERQYKDESLGESLNLKGKQYWLCAILIRLFPKKKIFKENYGSKNMTFLNEKIILKGEIEVNEDISSEINCNEEDEKWKRCIQLAIYKEGQQDHKNMISITKKEFLSNDSSMEIEVIQECRDRPLNKLSKKKNGEIDKNSEGNSKNCGKKKLKNIFRLSRELRKILFPE